MFERARIAAVFVLAACGGPAPSLDWVSLDDDEPGVAGDLPLGTIEGGLGTEGWGSALECKPIPALSPLVAPRIVISLDGMTVHVRDEATGYDRVFPAGVGAINENEDEASYGESLSYYPIIATKRNDFALRSGSNVACKIWWTDPETGEKKPVFAGLPFLSFYGSYAMHGPIDNFTAPNGGHLTRGYVSHGCVRMESADILEIHARLGRLARVPVRVQREPERAADGARTNARPWIGHECRSDLDCDFPGGFCHENGLGGRGFCSARCTRTCSDRAGSPITFCVADPDAPSRGMCVAKTNLKNYDCRPYDHLQPRVVARFGQASVTASVCLPGSRGWIGDRCAEDADCREGNTCQEGLCTQACSRACPDLPGTPWTTCVRDPETAALGCARQCTLASNASECPFDTSCAERVRAAGDKRTVCVQ